MDQWKKMYAEKLTTADEAVKLVKDGDVVEYAPYVTAPWDLDRALSKRKGELKKVFVKGCTFTYVPEVFKVDPQGETFLLNDSFWSATTRKMKEQGEVYINPGLYGETAGVFAHGYLKNDFMYVPVTPMDKNGFFNISVTCSFNTEVLRMRGGTQKGLKLVVEVNEKLPVVHGDTSLHVSEVDYIVEEENPRPLQAIGKVEATEADEKIAKLILGEMVDGVCLQIGIGGMPNLVGKMLVDSDLKDLGCHTEVFVDAYMDLFNAGKLTNAKKQIDIGKSVFTFTLGSAELYEFMDGNPSLRCLPVSYTNDPGVIRQNDRLYSICSCLAVDLFGTVSSESVGYKQISGIGGHPLVRHL
ncbi:MAG: butyryl-CoA:acetate CoA-transferase [Clostridiales Family XIII bacterium]|jgi:acyl-CoA hydrolase|nr:butyryl-CoA:acetate CoA-transferase [Clostridiales Family XIII bacterium]